MPSRGGEEGDESQEPAGDLYTDFDISDHLETARDVLGLRGIGPDSMEFSGFRETLNEVEGLLAERYETLVEYIATKSVDVVNEDDCISSSYHPWAMAHATQSAFDRAKKLLDMSEGEVRARCTFTGGVQIGRLPGVVQLDMLAPFDVLEERGLADTVREQYGL